MKSLKYIFRIIFCLVILNGCKVLEKAERNESTFMLDQQISLVKTVPGGSRAHIIQISRKGELCYKIGAISVLDKYDNKNIVFDGGYKEIKKTLNSNTIKDLNSLMQNTTRLHYNDPSIVKDNFQYFLYLDGHKKAFGYELHFDNYPSNLKYLISTILKETGKLYRIPGMS